MDKTLNLTVPLKPNQNVWAVRHPSSPTHMRSRNGAVRTRQDMFVMSDRPRMAHATPTCTPYCPHGRPNPSFVIHYVPSSPLPSHLFHQNVYLRRRRLGQDRSRGFAGAAGFRGGRRFKLSSPLSMTTRISPSASP